MGSRYFFAVNTNGRKVREPLNACREVHRGAELWSRGRREWSGLSGGWGAAPGPGCQIL